MLELILMMQVTSGAVADRGPAVGRALPPLEAVDQAGRVRRFDTLRGPKGLLLVLFRSADW